MRNMAALARQCVRWLAPLLCFVSVVATAQHYPSKPVRMIAPFPATGGVDVVARKIAQNLSASWGQQVIVDNRPGATGIIGTDLAAKAAPDGYTILMGNAATQAINVSLYNL